MSVKHYKNGQLTLIAGSGGGGGEESFTGTKAEVEQAIAAGQIKENWTVYITDDIEEVIPSEVEIDTLDSYDEIMTNIEEGKVAGALGVKEGFEKITSDSILSNINLKYNENTDMIQVYLNGEWVDAMSLGLQLFDFIKSSALTDWITDQIAINQTNGTMSFSSTSFHATNCDTSFNAIYHCPKVITKGDILKINGSYDYVGGHTLEFRISTDNGATWDSYINVDTTTVAIYEDLSKYSGKQITIRVHIRAANGIRTAVLNKFEISK